MGVKMIFNKGETFDFSGPMSVLDALDDAVDLSAWSISAAILMAGHTRRVSLTATWLDAGHTAFQVREADTSEWTEGDAEFGVTLESPAGDIVKSTPVIITIRDWL